MSSEPLNTPAELPAEYDRWNWGAFLLNWIWGIGNSVFIALLMFVPLVNVVMIFVLGARGSRWAWRNRAWRDLEHFRSAQRKWAIAGFSLIGVCIILAIAGNVLAQWLVRDSDALRLTMERLRSEPEVAQRLGQDFEPGWLMTFNISKSADGSGTAYLSFPVSGSRGEGRVISNATRRQAVWSLNQVEVWVNDGHAPIELGNRP